MFLFRLVSYNVPAVIEDMRTFGLSSMERELGRGEWEAIEKTNSIDILPLKG